MQPASKKGRGPEGPIWPDNFHSLPPRVADSSVHPPFSLWPSPSGALSPPRLPGTVPPSPPPD